jgi:hypothetical protein
MVARIRNYKTLLARAAALTIIAAAFVVLSGLPAQAQVFYGNPYGQSCQTYSFGVLGYTTCQPQPQTYYYGTPYDNNYYYGVPAPWTGGHKYEHNTGH